MLGTQRNGREDFHGMVGDEFEMISLLNHGQQQDGLHHRERRANTHTRSATEGKIGKPRDLSGTDGVFSPALRVESFRIGEKPGVALRDPLQDEYVRARGHAIAADFTIRNRPPADAPSRGIETHRFLDHHLDVAQSWKILGGRRAVA